MPPYPSGELALIRRIQQRAGTTFSRELQRGIGDDCAILRPRPGEDLLVTTDFSLEGRHFRRDWHSSATIGHRTLARGLSDLAAMGARPMAAFLSLALPLTLAQDKSWLNGFLNGLLTLARRFRVPLAGGDTSESPNPAVLADIVLLGATPRGTALRRDTARPGDRLFVTGALGGAAAQLEALQKGRRKSQQPPQEGPHFLPEPRLTAGRLLRQRNLATAAIDLSDGLSTDLHHLCEASHLSAEVKTALLPLSSLLAAFSQDSALNKALHGGEDYELLFAAPPGAKVPRTLGGVRLTEIGCLVPPAARRPSVTLIDPDGHRSTLKPGGWEHLR